MNQVVLFSVWTLYVNKNVNKKGGKLAVGGLLLGGHCQGVGDRKGKRWGGVGF